jgi:hypothetical protein
MWILEQASTHANFVLKYETFNWKILYSKVQRTKTHFCQLLVTVKILQDYNFSAVTCDISIVIRNDRISLFQKLKKRFVQVCPQCYRQPEDSAGEDAAATSNK